MGLGPVITKGFAERLGGELSLNSEPGSGTVFNLSLPYTPVKTYFSVSDKLKSKNGNAVPVAEDDDSNFYMRWP